MKHTSATDFFGVIWAVIIFAVLMSFVTTRANIFRVRYLFSRATHAAITFESFWHRLPG